MDSTDLELAHKCLRNGIQQRCDRLIELGEARERLRFHRRRHEHQTRHTLWRHESHLLRHEPAHRVTDDGRPNDSLRIHERDHIRCQVTYLVTGQRLVSPAVPALIQRIHARVA